MNAMTIQVAVHLGDAEHDAFHRWLTNTAIAVDPAEPHLDAGEAIGAMIRCCLQSPDISGQVASELRRERAAASE